MENFKPQLDTSDTQNLESGNSAALLSQNDLEKSRKLQKELDHDMEGQYNAI